MDCKYPFVKKKYYIYIILYTNFKYYSLIHLKFIVFLYCSFGRNVLTRIHYVHPINISNYILYYIILISMLFVVNMVYNISYYNMNIFEKYQ